MNIMLFVYNIFLIILYTCPVVYSLILYNSTKQQIYLSIGIVFLFFILDDTLIYMTEFLDSFSAIYDLYFIKASSIKIYLFLGIVIGYFIIQKNALKKELSILDYVILGFFTLSLIISPLVLHNPTIVLFYYLPQPFALYYLAFSGLKYLKDNSNLIKENHLLSTYKKLLIFTIICISIMLIEDIVLIFYFKIYSNILVKNNYRSIFEDILSIYYAYFAIKYCIIKLNLPKNLINSNMETNKLYSVHVMNSNLIFYKYVNYYNLTNREQDIFKLILDNKNNKEISEDLYITVGTVKTHIHNIFKKIDVSKRNELLINYTNFHNEIIKFE